MGTPSLFLYEREYGIHAHYCHAEKLLPLSHEDTEQERQGNQEYKQAQESDPTFHLCSRQMDQVRAKKHTQAIYGATVL